MFLILRIKIVTHITKRLRIEKRLSKIQIKENLSPFISFLTQTSNFDVLKNWLQVITDIEDCWRELKLIKKALDFAGVLSDS